MAYALHYPLYEEIDEFEYTVDLLNETIFNGRSMPRFVFIVPVG